MRLTILLSLALTLALAGCAATKGRRVRNRSEASSEKALSAESGAQADIDCARGIRKDIQRFCNDAPSEPGEGYAARARSAYADAQRRCDGLRGLYALRAFDACVLELEALPSQLEDETRARREAAAAKATEARGDPVFDKLLRKKRAAQEEADSSAEAFREAVQNQDADAIRFRREEWTEAEAALKVAQTELREYLEKAELDLRDVSALGLW